MFKTFLTALESKIITFLTTNKGFFEMSKAEREKSLENISIPKTFKNYLLDITGEQFMEDTILIVAYIHSSQLINIVNNPFFLSFLDFITDELANKIDYLDSHFYLLKKIDRDEIALKLLPGESSLAQSLREIIVNNTYQQVAEEIHGIGSKVKNTPHILVQSPREINMELKREIRHKLLEKHPSSFPVFQVNRKLIGGIRIFENGQSTDNSWISRVFRFTSLTTN